MEVSVHPIFETRFGMFVPCDRATYRRLKRLRHLLTFADVMARRWSRAQRRLPKNRWFRRGRARRVVSDAMLCPPFWLPASGGARATEARDILLRDYQRARHPAASRGEVVPLTLMPDELEALQARLERWYGEVFLPW